MTVNQKAQAGLALIKEAVCDYLATQPQGVRSVRVRKALALKSDREGTLFVGHWLIASVLGLLVREGKVRDQTIRGYRHYFLVTQPETSGSDHAD